MTQDEMNHLLEKARLALLSDDNAVEKYDVVLLLETVKFYMEVITAGWPIEQPRRVVNVLQTTQQQILNLRTRIKQLDAALKHLVDESERVALAERQDWQPLLHLERAIEQGKAALTVRKETNP